MLRDKKICKIIFHCFSSLSLSPPPSRRVMPLLLQGLNGGGGDGVGNDEKEEEGAMRQLQTLRTLRVLRPLKLVSGVPSKSILLNRLKNEMWRGTDHDKKNGWKAHGKREREGRERKDEFIIP